MISLIIPACNEEACISTCLDHIMRQRGLDNLIQPVEIIVAANGCSDGTLRLARNYTERFRQLGLIFDVIDIQLPSKTVAINVAERQASYKSRAYLDADTCLGPTCIASIIDATRTLDPVFISSCLRISPNPSAISRAYGRALLRLPHFSSGRTGAGFYAVNEAGRSRWDRLPEIISDDMFVRWHFKDEEVRVVSAEYWWPLPVGWAALAKVRRRQEIGLRQLEKMRPDLSSSRNSRVHALLALASLAMIAPLDAVAYTMVLARAGLRLDERDTTWYRDRRAS